MAGKIPVLKFGGRTLQGLKRFGPDEERLLDNAKQQETVNDIYRLLAERRNIARSQRLHQIARQFIRPLCEDGTIPVVVVSAFDWATDKLSQLAACISPQPSPREYARLLMSGELRATAALSITLEAVGVPARSLTGREAGIVTGSGPVDGIISKIHIGHVLELLGRGIVPVVAGFQGYYYDPEEQRDEVSILGRGGSNQTAVALADALDQPDCVMFTNVDGVYDKDPNTFDDAQKLDDVAASELFTWDPFPNVIQREAVEYAVEAGVDIWVRSGFDAELSGTLIKCSE
jgi:aspartate kinase